MTGTAYLKADEKVEAKRAFDFVLKSIDNQHMYALCALGNVQVALARSARHNPKEVYINPVFGEPYVCANG